MAPNLPPRYQPQVRLGADGDVEEWLATDTALDRPVLVRVLAAEASRARVEQFLTAARGAAGIVHSHLAGVYDVGSHHGTAHAVLEWTGGVTVADRLRAGEGIPADEFLPNAAGLAEGLATLHDAGVAHGAVDPSAIHFSASHPAKLGGFGRRPRTGDQKGDTAGLAAAMRAAVTGSTDASIHPSQVVDGLTTEIDEILERAVAGTLDARSLAAMLHALPSQRPQTARGWSWGWIFPVAALTVAAVLVTLVGLGIGTDPNSPFLFPATPSPTRAPPAITTTVGVTTTTPPSVTALPGSTGYEAGVYDPPPGDGQEQNSELGGLSDGRTGTAWRTERYFSQLRLIKEGVGVWFRVHDQPSGIRFAASSGTRFEIRWAADVAEEIGGWELIASGSALGTIVELQLPERDAGVWLLWLVEVPEQSDGVFFAEVSEVTFLL